MPSASIPAKSEKILNFGCHKHYIGGFTISQKFYMWLLKCGYVLIAFSLIMTFFSVFADSQHLVVLLEVDPLRYINWVWETVAYYVAPLAAGLSLLIVGYVKTWTSRQLLPRIRLLAFGIVLFGLGLVRTVLFLDSYYSTRDGIAYSSMSATLLDPILYVYLTWIVGHILLMLSGIITLGVEYNIYLSENDQRSLLFHWIF